MRKRKWYERMSAAVLIAVLLVNHGDMGIMAKAETIPALEENLEEENKKIEAETASASNADEKRDTTVDSNETTESDLEKEIATASNGKETPEIKRKMAKSAMNAEPVTEVMYSISQPTEGTFQVSGGSLTEDGENLNSLTDAFNKILSFGTDTNININFDNVNISSGAPKLTKGCKLTLKGTYTSEVGAFIIGSNDTFIIHNEANIKTVKTGSYVIGRSSAPNSTVIFEQNGGTVESVDGFYMYENDVISLNGGTINGNARGNGGTGSIKIKDGTWNGQLAHIKDIDICGGQLNNIKDDTSTITAISESEEVSISGGKIYVMNTNPLGRAFAILMSDETKLSLSDKIDISAAGGNTNGSIYYGMAKSCATIDAVNLGTINDSFKFVVSDLAMKASSSLKNWIKGSSGNMKTLVEGIHLSIVNHNSNVGYADQYKSYEARAVGNYIRIMDSKAESSLIPAGNIKSAEIQLLSNTENYQVTITYDKTEDGTEPVKTVEYTKAQVTVSGIIDEILLRNTGTDGLEISVGTIKNPIAGDITVDTGNADDKPVLLKGKITGKVNVVGTGTLESEINCSGFNGETKSTIHITGGEIIGTVNADNANESVITLTSADLIVDGNAHIVDQSAYSSQNRYAISAIGGVSVTMNDGRIESTNNTAVYINRLGSSGLQEDHAKFEMTGGTIKGGEYGLKHTQLNEITLSGGTISGGENQPDVYMANGKTGTSGTADFTVIGDFPFSSMLIENVSVKNEINFTEATVTGEEKIQINLPWVGGDTESNAKLFKASTSNYQNLIKHIELTGGSNPICVVYNANPVSADPTTTEIYAFSAPNPYTVHVKYYTGKDENNPFYEEYLLNLDNAHRSYLSNISLPDGKDCKVWRYKENSNRNGTATDVTKTVNELVNGERYSMDTVPEIELYAGYSVSIEASVSEEDITKESAIIKGNTAGTTVYYTNKSAYQIYTGEELRNAAKSTEKQSDFTPVKVEEDGTFSIPLTGLDPLKEYTYYLVAENSNMDVSDSCAVTFTTKARVLTAVDFQIVGDREFTYENNGATHTVTVKPAAGNEELFDIDFVVYKMKKGEEYTGSYLQPPAAAGTYGIYVTTKPKKSGIEQAKYLLIGDMTIKKAKFNPEWFNIVDSITYGTEEYESLKPWIKDEYNGVGGPAVTEYGQIEYKLYTMVS